MGCQAPSASRKTWLKAGLDDAFGVLVRLPGSDDDPAAAWGAELAPSLPGPALYWGCTLAALVAAVMFVHRLLVHQPVGTDKRRCLGIEVRSRLANKRDLRPLIVDGPMPGRMSLGKVGSALVVTEDRSAATGRGRRHPRLRDRSAVAVLGPTRCGKTANVISGILEWKGPALLFWVKNDLLAATVDERSRLGEVRCSTRPEQPTWKRGPGGRHCGRPPPPGAQKAARALADAAPKAETDNSSSSGPWPSS